MSRTIQGLIFDNGDILFDASLWRRWLAEHLSQLHRPLRYEDLVPIWERHLVDVYCGRQTYWDAFRAMLTQFGIDESDHDPIVATATEKGRQLQALRKPNPHVPETLEQLSRRGIRLAVLSDSESGQAGVRKILQQLKIETHFDAVISSVDIGVVKPEPAAFTAAIEALALPKQTCAFVGHDVDELSGAMAIDLFAIGYNHTPGAPADVFIDSFAELLELVQSP